MKIRMMAMLVAYTACLGIQYPSREILMVNRIFDLIIAGERSQVALQALERIAEGSRNPLIRP